MPEPFDPTNPPADAAVIIVSPTTRAFTGADIPGASRGVYHCLCGAGLLVAPSTMRWLAAHPAADPLHLCMPCAARYGPAIASGELGGGPVVGVEMMPGSVEDLEAAGLPGVAAGDAAVRDYWRHLFGTRPAVDVPNPPTV